MGSKCLVVHVKVANRLGLNSLESATQVIPRVRL
jgi:AhpD family alkylhydroperoxidase